MKQLKFLMILLTLLLLSGCAREGGNRTTPSSSTVGDSAREVQSAEPLLVVASYSILGEWVERVGGDHVEVRMLVGPGGDAHTFEPTPADGVALARANLIFENGLQFEPWLDNLYDTSDSNARRVVVSEGLELIPADDVGDHDDDHDDDDHGEYDPHLWHDVANASAMVERVRDALIEADPANADSYRANAEAYLTELQELDEWVRQEVAQLPEERRRLVTSHDTFGYFARRYGFEVIGTAFGSLSTEVSDPSAAGMVQLIEQIREAGVPVIFAENVANPALMETIAEEAGVEVAPSLYTDALGEVGSPGESYIQLIRYNVTTIVEALGS